MRETNKALRDRLRLSKSEISDLQQSLEPSGRKLTVRSPVLATANISTLDDVAVENALANGNRFPC